MRRTMTKKTKMTKKTTKTMMTMMRTMKKTLNCYRYPKRRHYLISANFRMKRALRLLQPLLLLPTRQSACGPSSSCAWFAQAAACAWLLASC